MTEMTESIWDRFDHIAVQDFTGYRERRSDLDAEFARVGLQNRTTTYWTYPTPLNGFLRSALRCNKDIGNDGTLDCTLGHYRILKTAYELGFNHLLVFEDDIRFLKDTNRLHDIVSELPEDFDFAKFEWYTRGFDHKNAVSRPRIGHYWIDGHGIKLLGTGMVAFSRKGMKWKIDRIESAFLKKDELHSIDIYDRPGTGFMPPELKCYLALPLGGIQGTYSRNMHKRVKDYDLLMLENSRESYGGANQAR